MNGKNAGAALAPKEASAAGIRVMAEPLEVALGMPEVVVPPMESKDPSGATSATSERNPRRRFILDNFAPKDGPRKYAEINYSAILVGDRLFINLLILAKDKKIAVGEPDSKGMVHVAMTVDIVKMAARQFYAHLATKAAKGAKKGDKPKPQVKAVNRPRTMLPRDVAKQSIARTMSVLELRIGKRDFPEAEKTALAAEMGEVFLASLQLAAEADKPTCDSLCARAAAALYRADLVIVGMMEQGAIDSLKDFGICGIAYAMLKERIAVNVRLAKSDPAKVNGAKSELFKLQDEIRLLARNSNFSRDRERRPRQVHNSRAQR